jgi:myosin V
MDDKLEIYTKGTKAWFKDKEEGYVVATLADKVVTAQSVKLNFVLDATGSVSCN